MVTAINDVGDAVSQVAYRLTRALEEADPERLEERLMNESGRGDAVAEVAAYTSGVQPDTAGRQIATGKEGEEGRLAGLARKVLVFVWLRRFGEELPRG